MIGTTHAAPPATASVLGRLPVSQTNVNMASVASEAQAHADSAATGVGAGGSGTSPLYLVGGSLNVALMLWGVDAPSHTVTVVHVMPDARTIVTGSDTGQSVLWTVNFKANVCRFSHL